jgi:uncharacterized protein (TIGR02246 family)
VRTIFWLGILGLVSCVPVGAQAPKSGASEASIRKLLTAAETTWADGDVAAYSKLWAENADFVGPTGERFNGHAALVEHFTKLLTGAGKGSRLSFDVDTIRFLKPDVALLDLHLGVSGRHSEDGSHLPALKLPIMLLVTQKAGHWYIDSFREMGATS